jgi:DNA mismatch repair ATPase MutS
MWRLAVVLAGAALAWWNFWLLPIPVAAFIALMVVHERVARQEAFERRAIGYYERALERLDNRWAGHGEAGDRFQDADHPYAGDLDVFGRGSVFQLINNARTAAGEATLAEWLKAPAEAEEVRNRQEAVDELRDRVDLREDLALLGEDVRSSLHVDTVMKWGGRTPEDVRPWYRAAAFVLALALLVTFSGYMLHLWRAAPILIVILLELLFFTMVRRTVNRILAAVDMPARDLRILAAVLERLEREPLRSRLLTELRARLATDGAPPSKQIAHLRRLIEYRDQTHNQMFAIVAEPLLWSVHFAFAIERWRQRSGPHIGEWIAAVGEIEALSSLAGYAAEHPADPFPELVDDGPLFEGQGIAHPLLPESIVVRNDVCLDGSKQLLLVSGSNMSGKSTLLRSVGLNAVLAWAGAPVRATRLRVSPLAAGASMRIQDSVLDGKSRFYAEITRLRQVVDMAGRNPPLLFLLDELLSGTNSHDRRIGSEAVVRTLVERGAIGLVTTHDLALAQVADALAPRAANVHFEDHIEDGRIAFDYRMRPGVVRKSNALELMRSVGLEV